MSQNVYVTVLGPQKLLVLAQYPWTDPEVAGDTASYLVVALDGGFIPIFQATVVGNRGVYLETPGEVTFPVGVAFHIQFDPSLTLLEGIPLSPNPLVAERPLPKQEVSFSLGSFSGENVTPFLGEPAGQVFFSPALENPVSGSTIEVDQVSTCVDLVDHYQIPVPVDPKIFFLFGAYDPGLIGDTSFTLGGGGAFRYVEATWDLAPTEEDDLDPYSDGPATGLLVENFDPARVALLNNPYWTLEGTGTEPQPFICADTTAPIPPGATIGPFPLLSG